MAQEATPTPTPGSLDPSYGVNGFAATVISPSNWPVGVAVQGDGKAVVAVHGTNPSGSGSDFYAARFDAAGYLDPGFGSGGVVRLQFTSAADAEHVEAVAVQPDGKILLAGHAYVKRSTFGFAVARLNLDGSPDTSFGSGGKVFFGFSSSMALRGMALQSDGRIVLVGNSLLSNGSGNDFTVARLTPNGQLDGTFGSGGKVSVQTSKNGTDGGCNAVAIQLVNGQERIVVAGTRPGTSQVPRDFAVMRFTPAGALDATFGSGGKVFTDFGGTLDSAGAVAVVADGIVVGGRSVPNVVNSIFKFAIAKYTPNGQPDPSFGGGTGKVTTNFPHQAMFQSLAVQADGKIVAGGEKWYSQSATPSEFALVRYNTDGSPDASFGPTGDGIVVTDYAWRDHALYGLVVQADGKILAAGGSYPTTPGPSVYVVLMRHLP